MSRLVVINGAPGSGKSTMSTGLAQDEPLTLALDIDMIKHALGRWDHDPSSSGLHARRLSLVLAREQLDSGLNVVVAQYLASTTFIEDLEHLADECGAAFHEFVLDLDAVALAERLIRRATDPDRPEHEVNNRHVGPEDAETLVQSLQDLRTSRPRAIWVDARGSRDATLSILRSHLGASRS
ncbi:AAA family ATPase [Terrabacter sp. BE26]|uniref:AAA family ATPase n=1 Tax=Terrabacter sp. BE26 TaxID=2898152 RepID=UPI0035BE60F0